MSQPAIDRDRLASILERYGDSLDSFDALRPDSYEQALARYSLDSLESFYAILFTPAQTLAEAASKCPTWPLGCKRERQRPSTHILSQVGERMRTRAALGRVSQVGKFLAELRKEIKATPLGDNQMILDGFCGALGQKLMQDIRDGKPIEENLKLVEKLQAQRLIEQNEKRLEQNDKKIADMARRTAILEAKLADAQEAKKKIEEALVTGKTKGGLTPETLARIEEAAKLL